MWRKRVRSRSRGQSVVEFGLVAVIFGLMVSGIYDFGILLNGWLGVSSSARDVARQLAVGICPSGATASVCASGGGGIPMTPSPSSLPIQGLDRSLAAPVTVTVCVENADLSSGCYPKDSSLINIYGGTCDMTNFAATCNTSGTVHPTPNDAMVVTVTAQLEVVTPLVRPAFGCPGSQLHCRVPISSRAVARYEGPFI
jgi:Flp pilus assembly protein TadG